MGRGGGGFINSNTFHQTIYGFMKVSFEFDEILSGMNAKSPFGIMKGSFPLIKARIFWPHINNIEAYTADEFNIHLKL